MHNLLSHIGYKYIANSSQRLRRNVSVAICYPRYAKGIGRGSIVNDPPRVLD